MAERAVHVLIHGHVQGVGYRAWCAERAVALGLSGWVRNLSTGEVEAVFSGAVEQVDAMISACAEGAPGARVSEVRTVAEVSPVSGGFEIRRSA